MTNPQAETTTDFTPSIIRGPALGGVLAFLLAGAPLVGNAAPCNYSVSAPPGYSMIANQCDATGGNTLNNVLPVAPNGSQIHKWNCALQMWEPTATFTGGSWTPSLTLNPGEGAFFFNPTASAVTLNFNGNLPTPVLPLTLPANGCCIVSRQVPLVAGWNDIEGLPPQDGDVVYQFMNPPGVYAQYTYLFGAWSPSDPMAAVGESVWICRGGGASPSPLPCAPDVTPPVINCACLEMLIHDLLVTNACLAVVPDLCLFTNCFTDNCCLSNCMQTPAAGTVVPPGTYPITIKLTDCAGNMTTNCRLDFVVHEPTNGCFRTNAVVPCGATVVTCFSGQCYLGNGVNATNPVLAVVDVNNPPPPTPASSWPAPMYHGELFPSTKPTWTSENLGEIFGVTLDNQNPPNIFVTAAGFYCGLPPSGVDVNGVNYGPSGPGAVYRIDGQTAAISCFAQLLPNSGVGLGNICHDPVSGVFFVSSFENGFIYGVPANHNCSLPTPPVCWDHGVQGRPAEGLSVIADSGAPGVTQLRRRVWGLQVLGRRLYYSVWNENGGNFDGMHNLFSPTDANEIWSVGLNSLGSCVGPAKREITLPPLVLNACGAGYDSPNGQWSSPVSDIKFSPDGLKMLLSERSVNGLFPNTAQPPVNAHISRVLEYTLNPGPVWGPAPNQRFHIGTGPSANNSEGGADYTCENLIWATGDLYGPTPWIYGLAGIPKTGNLCNNSGTTSVFVDLDGQTAVPDKSEIGDVVIRRCCDCCIKITNKSVECVNTNMTYKWDFCVTNCWTNSIKYFSFLDLPPGVTLNEDIITLPLPLAPGQGTCLTLYLTNQSGLEFTNLCFIVGAHTTNFDVCCSVTNCLTLPPCCVWISGDVATPITGQPNCYTYNPGLIKNLSDAPVKYLFLLPQPDAPNNCFSFSPNVITFNPPLLPNQTAVPGQMSPATLKLTVNPPCPMPFCFLASLHDSNLVNCCSAQKYITRVKKPVDCVFWASPTVAAEGTDVPVSVIVDGSDVGAVSLTLFEGTNAVKTIVDPADGQHDDIFVLSNAVAGTYTFTWKLTDDQGAVWCTDPATFIVVRQEDPIIPPVPLIAPAALNGGNITFSLLTQPGVTCNVEYKESLNSPTWTLLRTIVGDGSVVTVIDAVTNGPQRFYRVRMQ